jgi:hypothetical protein
MKKSAFYIELEKRGFIGAAINTGLNVWSLKSNVSENLSKAKLDTPMTMHNQYALGSPSNYSFGANRIAKRTLNSWRR